MARILIVDDETSLITLLSALMTSQQHEVVTATNGKEAMERLEAASFDVMLSDIRMTPMDGLQLLKKAVAHDPDMVCVLLTAYSSVESAIEAMKDGAFDYVTKPFKVANLLETVRSALEYRQAKQNMGAETRPEVTPYLDNIMAESDAMKAVCDLIRRIGPTDMPVLICGETGSGKTLIATSLHARSHRADKPLRVVDCREIAASDFEGRVLGVGDTPGIVNEAGGGSVLFKDVDTLSLSHQAVVLQQLSGAGRHIPEIRVLASTAEDLQTAAASGAFDARLLARLISTRINVPPLRERHEDILPIAFSVVNEAHEGEHDWSIDWEARLIFEAYSWPGNVQELADAIHHALAFTENDCITRTGLPPKLANVPIDAQEDEVTKRVASMRGDAMKEFLHRKKDELRARQQALAKAK